MKVYIGPYINRWTTSDFENWCMSKLYGEEYWRDEFQDRTAAKVIEWAGNVWQPVLDHSVNLIIDRMERKRKIRIDPYDTWSMDDTLAPIILAMLRQLKDTKHGSPYVDDEDVPHLPKQGFSSNESMQYDMFASEEHDDAVWKSYETRWDYVMDCMIFSMEQLSMDWEAQFYHDDAGPDSGFYKVDIGIGKPFWVDEKGRKEYDERIQVGLTLFGKYFRALWD
jgi:hypothetical protein